MKEFYAVLCLFAIMLGAMIFNYQYIGNLSQQFIDALKELPAPDEHNDVADQANQIRMDWENHRRFVQITAIHTEIEAISNAADELCVFAEYQNNVEFEKARQLLINAFEELALSEKIFSSYVL